MYRKPRIRGRKSIIGKCNSTSLWHHIEFSLDGNSITKPSTFVAICQRTRKIQSYRIALRLKPLPV